MQIVRISDRTYKRLLSRVQSFDDDPETVIERLLDQSDGDRSADAAPVPARPTRQSLSLGEYFVPILEILADAGGAAPAKNIIATLETRLGGKLGPADRERVRSGEPRWKNRARFARLRMKERGLVSSPDHGVWGITEAGYRYIADARDSR